MATIRTQAHDNPGTASLAEWMVRLAAALIGLAALAVIAMGVSLVLDDLSTQGEWLDGLGTFFGLVFSGLGAILGGVALFVAWLVGRHPLAAAVVVCAVGVLVAVAGGVTMASLGEMVSAATVCGGLLVGALGLAAALNAGRVAITSPGGDTR